VHPVGRENRNGVVALLAVLDVPNTYYLIVSDGSFSDTLVAISHRVESMYKCFLSTVIKAAAPILVTPHALQEVMQSFVQEDRITFYPHTFHADFAALCQRFTIQTVTVVVLDVGTGDEPTNGPVRSPYGLLLGESSPYPPCTMWHPFTALHTVCIHHGALASLEPSSFSRPLSDMHLPVGIPGRPPGCAPLTECDAHRRASIYTQGLTIGPNRHHRHRGGATETAQGTEYPPGSLLP
jgi:hypothetical protein